MRRPSSAARSGCALLLVAACAAVVGAGLASGDGADPQAAPARADEADPSVNGRPGAAAAEDLTPSEVALLTELEAAIATQQRALDATEAAPKDQADPAARQVRQREADALRRSIRELTELRDQLRAPPSPVAPAASHAAAALERQLHRQERRSELILDDRLAAESRSRP